MEVGMRE
jgi:hypothetical protein